MKALVTGGAGFIGSHVADRLLARGHEVHIIDNFASGKRENVPPGAILHEQDIRSPETAQLIRGSGFDLIAHLAAQIDVRASVSDPLFDSAVNIGGTLNLLEAARMCGRCPRVVFASTGGALYGEVDSPPSDESTPKNPDAPYGIAKLSAEQYLAYYGRVHGMDCVVLRFGNVYGPRQDPHGEAGVIAIFCGRLGEGRSFNVFGDGRQTRDYIFVGDVADAFVTAAGAELPPVGGLDARAFNIGTGVETSVIEVAEGLLLAAGQDGGIEFAPARAGEVSRSCLDPSKAERVLGWNAKVGLREGLAVTWAWASSVAAAK